MVSEMTNSQKAAAVHLYQQQLASSGNEVYFLKMNFFWTEIIS